jgi:hypothetical protein
MFIWIQSIFFFFYKIFDWEKTFLLILQNMLSVYTNAHMYIEHVQFQKPYILHISILKMAITVLQSYKTMF